MARTLGLYGVAAAVVAGFWLRLEDPRGGAGETIVIVLLALAPALVRRLRARVAVGAGAAAVAVVLAFDVPRHHAFGTLWDRFSNGLLDFYDYRLPIDAGVHPWMHGVILAAVFAFCLALGLAVAARRAGIAVALLLLGAGWPATILTGGRTTLHGAVILAAALALLGGLTLRPSARVLIPLGAALLVAGVAASGTAAVAKRQLLDWQQWDFYTRPQQPVGVRYVWNYSYGGLRFPKKVTTVLKIKAPGESLYWRATTLDFFDGTGWSEALKPAETSFDPLLPAAARDRSEWVRADVTVEALRDFHLVGASVPVAYRTGGLPVQTASDGVAILPRGVARGDRYTVWSYSPEPTLAELGRERADYPAAVKRFLEVAPGVVAPPFGVPGRAALVDGLFARNAANPLVREYRGVYRRARSLAAGSDSPYATALAIETWLRRTGGFRYDPRPPVTPGPPLAAFVTRTKAGYCQHFAGAMALMLRYLGIPARVAAGFVSGTYDSHKGEWTITDHDAHAWVEVWFPSYGWLPFDPTPGRGTLSGTYSASSRRFNIQQALSTLRGRFPFEAHRLGAFENQASAFERTAGDVPRRRGGSAFGPDHPVRNLFRLLGLVLAGALLLIVGVKLVVRRLRYATRDPRRVAAACRRELADFLVDQRIDVPRSATLHELGARVDETLGVDADAFVAAATAARFGPAERADAAAVRARRELRELERRIRAQLDRGERFRGLVSLRSLGFSAGR